MSNTSFSATVHAYPSSYVYEIDKQCRRYFNGSSLYVYYKNGVDVWSRFNTGYTNAAQSWTSTPTHLWLRYSASTTQVVVNTVWNSSNDNLGWTNQTCSGNTLTNSSVWLNRYQEYLGGWSTRSIQQLSAHEMGHAVGLGHIDDSSPAIMWRYVPDGNIYYFPQSDDIALVNQVYP